MDLTQKNILITGATGGIGSALAKEFAKKGASLILTDLSEEKLRNLKNELVKDNHTIVAADFTDQQQVLDLVEKVNSTYNKLDILINNAGIGVYEDLENISPEGWFDSFEVNVHAPFILSKLLLPMLINSSSPIILNVGSVCGVDPKDYRVAYNSTKFALRGLSLTMSDEFKDSELKVSLLTLGSVLTDFGPTSLEERKELQKEGKDYLTTSFVANTIIEKIETNKLEDEIVLK